MALVLTATPSTAVTLTLNYTGSDEENPSWDPFGTVLIEHFEAVAAMWEQLLPNLGNPNTEVVIDFEWDDDIDNAGLTTDNTTHQTIELNPNSTWYADPNPWTHDEFDLDFQVGRVHFSDLSAFQQLMFFPYTPPPATLEVGFFALPRPECPDLGTMNPCSGASGVSVNTGFDLFTAIAHEMGHAIAIGAEPLGEPGAFNIYPHHVGLTQDVAVSESEDGGHFAGGINSFWLMASNIPGGQRRFPSATDVLVAAEDDGLPRVHLQRVDRISSQFSNLWDATALFGDPTWIGGETPNQTQDVFVGHGGLVQLSKDESARTLNIEGLGSQVRTNDHQLTVVDNVDIVSGLLQVSTGGELITAGLRVGNRPGADGVLAVTGGLTRVEGLLETVSSSANQSTIQGVGNIEVFSLLNNGRIRAVTPDAGVLSIHRSSLASDVLDLDGDVLERGEVLANEGNLVLNGQLTDDFNGTMEIDDGHFIVMDSSWTIGPGGVLQLGGSFLTPSSLLGASALVTTTVRGDIRVDGNGALATATTIFEPEAHVEVAHSSSRLILDTHTMHRGGTYLGGGIIEQRQSAVVEADTRMDVVVYNWDGLETDPSTTRIEPGVTFTINSHRIEYDDNGFDGTVMVNGGVLEVNTLVFDEDTKQYVTSPWQIDPDGLLNLSYGFVGKDKTKPLAAVVRGAPIDVHGNIESIGLDNTIEAEIAFHPTADVRTVNANSSIRLANTTTYHGGSFTGDGTLHQYGDSWVNGNTVIDMATYDWDGNELIRSITTIAPGVQLTINSPALDVPGEQFEGGAILDGGTLQVNVPNRWSFGDGGLLHLINNNGPARVLGSEIDMEAQILVSGGNEIIAPISFHSAAEVVVPQLQDVLHLSDILRLRGHTNYHGGTFHGDGGIIQDATAYINEDTQIDVQFFDMDGVSEQSLIELHADLTLDVDRIDMDDNRFQGALEFTQSSRLAVNTSSRWEMDGFMNIVGPPSTVARIAGADVHLAHDVMIDNDNHLVFESNVSGPGNFLGAGTVEFLGEYHPGNSPGRVTFEGNLEFAPTATFMAEVEGFRDDEHDVIVVQGTANLAGTLHVITRDNEWAFLDDRGETRGVHLLDASRATGAFESILFNGERWDGKSMYLGTTRRDDGLFQLLQTAGGQVVLGSYLAIPGDANGDFYVDAMDFNIWLSHRDQEGTNWSMGDFTGDGRTDARDFAVWSEFRFTQARSELAAVPEPTCIPLLALLSCAGIAAHRRARTFGYVSFKVTRSHWCSSCWR